MIASEWELHHWTLLENIRSLQQIAARTAHVALLQLFRVLSRSLSLHMEHYTTIPSLLILQNKRLLIHIFYSTISSWPSPSLSEFQSASLPQQSFNEKKRFKETDRSSWRRRRRGNHYMSSLLVHDVGTHRWLITKLFPRFRLMRLSK